MSEPSMPIAVQLYSLRHLTLPLEELLSQVAKMGYHGVETVNDHGLTVDEMNSLLAKYNLKVASTHVGLQLLQDDLDGVIAFNKGVGNHVLVVPALPQEMRGPDGPGWAKAGKLLDELGARCAAAGMTLLYHNHGWEMELFEGRRAIDWLMESASPDHLGFEPDLAWVQHGGADPLAILQQYAGRCPRVHAKDLAKPGESDNDLGLADVGYGVLDWDALLPAAKAAGAEWVIVEHDIPSDPMASIRRSVEFLTAKLS